MKLLENVTANGTYSEQEREWWITRERSPLEEQTIYVWGTFDGATVELQFSPDGLEWFTPPNATWTAKSVANLTIGALYVRAVVSGVGATTSVNLTVL